MIRLLRVLDALFLPGFWLFFISMNDFLWLRNVQEPLSWSVISLILTVAVAAYMLGGVVGLIVKPFGIRYREDITGIPWLQRYHLIVLAVLILLSLFLALRMR